MSTPHGVLCGFFPFESVPCHMALLSFLSDKEGAAFRTWWYGPGHAAFEAWQAAAHADKGEPD